MTPEGAQEVDKHKSLAVAQFNVQIRGRQTSAAPTGRSHRRPFSLTAAEVHKSRLDAWRAHMTIKSSLMVGSSN